MISQNASACTYMTSKKVQNEGFAPFLISQSTSASTYMTPKKVQNEGCAPFLISQNALRFDCMSFVIGGNTAVFEVMYHVIGVKPAFMRKIYLLARKERRKRAFLRVFDAVEGDFSKRLRLIFVFLGATKRDITPFLTLCPLELYLFIAVKIAVFLKYLQL